MITLLSKFFIKSGISYEEERLSFGKLSGICGIMLNILLFAGKFFAGTISGSVAITADALNNLSDAGSSITTLFGFKLAGQKPDREHPYGHGRIEYIAGIAVAGIILVMGFELLKSSFNKILHPEDSELSIIIVCILIASLLVKCYMALYNFRLGKKYDSPTLNAVGLDSLTDCIATSVVLICSVISHYTGLSLDGYAGLVVSCFVLYAAYNAAKDSINPLLGQEPDPELVEDITEYCSSFDKNILGIHDLLIHDYGPSRMIISLHAEVPADGDILELHDIVDTLENKLAHEFKCIATIHLDPIVVNDPEVNALREKVSELAKELDESFTVHDFRMVPGDSHTNLIFDIVSPFEAKIPDSEVPKEMQKLVKEKLSPKYFTVIKVDKK